MLNSITIENVEKYSKDYQTDKPFPHIVIDDFMSKTFIKDLEFEMQNVSTIEQWRFDSEQHIDQVLKRWIREWDAMSPLLKTACQYFNSQEFIDILEKITGFKNLVADPILHGGGFHETFPGGRLEVHHDFTDHTILGKKMYRHVNLLIYLNEDWDQRWGGQLELWSKDLKEIEKKIELRQNRAVIFSIDGAPHGHPHPLGCPDGVTRRSLAFYYYTTEPTKNHYTRAMWKRGVTLS